MSNVPSFETTACDEIVRVNRLLQSLSDRAEKAERERDESRTTAETYRSVAGVAERTAEELRAKALDLGNQLVNATDALRTVSQFKANPSTCPSCEGPLTCAKCVTEPDETGTHEDRIADLEREVADHEARIKELEARLPRCPLCESSDGGHQNGCRWKR